MEFTTTIDKEDATMCGDSVKPALTLDQLKQMAIQVGYRIETSDDGTERLIRPDGSVAVIARPPKDKH